MEKAIPQKYSTRLIKVDSKKNGWKKKDIVEFLESQSSDIFAVLGGDVFKFDSSNSRYQTTYDSWYLDRRGPEEDFESFCLRCKSKALEYIQGCNASDNVVFVLVLSSEVTAGLD